MPEIQISISNKIATVQGNPTIACGNSDYKIKFSFDSEWQAYTTKTAKFTFYSRAFGSFRAVSVLFQGDTVDVPTLPTTSSVQIMLYAGDVHTTTPVSIMCTGEAPAHTIPDNNVYNQLLDYLAGLQGGGEQVGISELEFIGADQSTIGIADNDYPRQYKIVMTITAKRGSDTLNLTQMSELNFYDGNDNKLSLVLAAVTSSQSAYAAGQEASRLIDNNTSTKYCAAFINPMTITINSEYALDIAKFSYTTADDTPNRDPVSFTLQYSSDYGETFNTILTVENAAITTTRKTETQQWVCV